MEEAFNNPPGSALATNAPWTGTGAPLTVVTGDLSFTALRGLSSSGGKLSVAGGSDGIVVRNFTDTPVTEGNVYFSALIHCVVPPAVSNLYIASLQASGASGPSGRVDPLCLYVDPAPDGYRLGIRHTEIDEDFAPVVLATNTTHLIVMKYLFGFGGDSQLYIDPIPGAPEPATPDADSLWAVDSDDGVPVDPPDLRVVGFRAMADSGQGVFLFDTLRISTNWEDVVPTGLSISGPISQTACAGNSVSFSVTAAGTPPITYQWRTNGFPIPDATNSTYTLDHTGPADTLSVYDAVVTDALETASSATATLTLSTVPATISVPPANAILMPGDSSANFSVQATGDPPLSYQWRVNGTPMPGATSSSFTVVNASPTGGPVAYDVIVSNPCGSMISSPAAGIAFAHPFYSSAALPGFFSGMNLITTNNGGMALFVWSSPDLSQSAMNWAFEGQLSEQPLNDGSGRSLYSINVTPAASPVYYLIGETNAGPYIQPVPVQWITTDTNGNYAFVLEMFTISPEGILMAPGAPVITAQPASLFALAGRDVTLTSAASSVEPPSYQWYFSAKTPLAEATNAALTLASVTLTNQGSYFVVVANSYGSVTSSVATVTVLPPPVLSVHSAGNGFQISGAGIPGDTYTVEAATNLDSGAVWEILTTNSIGGDGLIQFVDTNATAFPARFYRVVFP